MGINPRAHLCINWRLSLSNTNVLARQFVGHKRGDQVCIAQTRSPRLRCLLPKGLAVSDPRSRGRSAVETVQVPGERTPPYSSVSDA